MYLAGDSSNHLAPNFEETWSGTGGYCTTEVIDLARGHYTGGYAEAQKLQFLNCGPPVRFRPGAPLNQIFRATSLIDDASR